MAKGKGQSRATSDVRKDEEIRQRVRKLKESCRAWASTQRQNFVDDMRFRHGDARNNAQWPANVLASRQGNGKNKPCLTLNIVGQHNLQIINSAKAARSAMQVVPTGDGATKASADTMQLLIGRVEAQSAAPLIYDMVREQQTDGGVGYFRIVTEYLPGDVFEQDLFLRPIPDAMSVWVDPASVMKTGADANYWFVEEVLTRDGFEAKYPEHRHLLDDPRFRAALSPADLEGDDDIHVTEFFERKPKFYTLVSFIDPDQGDRKIVRKDMLPPEVASALLADPKTRTRQVKDWTVEWTLFIGDEVGVVQPFPGRNIPLIRVPGEMTIIEGVFDMKSHTRTMLDAQRMYNYNASAQVEHVALQSKVPWVGPAEAIRGYEQIWKTANLEDHAYLPWRHVDEDGATPVPPPQRSTPPMASPAFSEGMQTAFNQMMMTSGQWQNQMGMQGNERTGSAIQERQEQGDIATYHFKAHFEEAQAYACKILIELFPIVYDTKRVMTILQENDEEIQVTLDPRATAIYQERVAEGQESIGKVLNPAVGRYDVRPSSGPDYASRREQTVQMLSTIMTQAPALTAVIGDLMLQAMPFKEAREAAARMRRMVPPQALGEGPSQQEQALQQQLAEAHGALAKVVQENAKLQLKYTGRAEMRDIDAYKAETDRIKAFGDALGLDPQVVTQMLAQLGRDTAQTGITHIQAANADDIGGPGDDRPGIAAGGPGPDAPHPDAQQGADGEWYLQDPTRTGKYMRIQPLATFRKADGR